MNIVRFALRYPYTFYVVAALILFLGVTAIRTMPRDIFPEIRIPVVTVIWQYTGLSVPDGTARHHLQPICDQLERRRHQEYGSADLQWTVGSANLLQPDVNLDLAISQIVSATNFIRVLMPPGIQAPVIVQFNASSVPVLQISLSSETLNEQQLYDYGIYRIRQRLAPIRGITLPTPAGGKYRQIMVDIDPTKLLAKGLTPMDVVNAVNAQNLTLPSGAAKIGNTQYIVRTNATPPSIKDLNDIPIKVVNGATVFVRDVGQVHDGWQVQQNIVREDGRRSVLLSIIKNGNASTLDVVSSVKDALSTIRAAAPSGMKIKELFDQSVFVSESVQGVLREMAIAAGLTAAMILLFLGSWRSTMVVMISIPLAIVTSIVVLYFLGETINTMTLGGLALAVGILVDDSTVTIENTHRLLSEQRMSLADATLHGAAGIAVPTLVSTLAICCVFTSVVFLEGPAKFLHPAWRGGHLRHAGVLRHFADLDPDHHRAAVEEWQTGEPIGVSQRHLHSIAWQVRAWFRTHAGWICGASDRSAEAARHCPDRLRAHPCTRFGIIFLRGSRLLSSDRRRSDTTACPDSGRNPDRSDRGHLPIDRGQDPRGGSPVRTRDHR